MKSGKIILGLLAGIATGALMGILFAPEKGSITRRKISSKCNDLVEEAGSKINNMAESINEQIDHAKNATEEMLATAKTKIAEVKKDLNA
jgi:gas vesicle protein